MFKWHKRRNLKRGIRLAAEKLGAASPTVFGNLSLIMFDWVFWVFEFRWKNRTPHELTCCCIRHTGKYPMLPDTHMKRLDVGYHETSRSIYCNLSATCHDVPRWQRNGNAMPKTSGCWLPHWDVVAAIDRVVWRVRVRWPHQDANVAVIWKKRFFGKVPDVWISLEGSTHDLCQTLEMRPKHTWVILTVQLCTGWHMQDFRKHSTNMWHMTYVQTVCNSSCLANMQLVFYYVLLPVAVLWWALHTTRPIRFPFATLKQLRSGPKFAVDFGIVIQRQTYRLKTNETNETGAAGTALSKAFQLDAEVARPCNSAVLQHEGRHSDFAAVLLQSMFLIRLIRLIRPIPKNARLSKWDEKCANSLPTNVQNNAKYMIMLFMLLYVRSMKCETLHLELLLQRQDLSHVDLLMVSWSFKLKDVQGVFSVSNFI